MEANVIPALAAFALAVLERLPRIRFRKSPLLRRYVVSDVVYLLTGFVAGASLALGYIAAASDLIGASFGVPRLSSLDLPLWVSVPAALVALDLGNYVAHWLLHRYPALWEFHKVHHSSETLDWLATFRSHLIEQAIRRLVAPVLLILAGFPIPAVTLAAGIFVAWAIFNHSNLRLNLRSLEPLLVTPRLHRLHHIPETDDRNFGTVFTVWDRLRGTLLVRDTNRDAAFGVAGEVTGYPQGWLAQFVEPPRRILAAWTTARANPDAVARGRRLVSRGRPSRESARPCRRRRTTPRRSARGRGTRRSSRREARARAARRH